MIKILNASPQSEIELSKSYPLSPDLHGSRARKGKKKKRESKKKRKETSIIKNRRKQEDE